MIGRIVAAGLVSLAIAGPAAAAAGGCHEIRGTFVAEPVPCADFLCTSGTLFGDFEGAYEFAGNPIGPDTLAGTSTITLENGAVVQGEDVSVVDFASGTFTTTVTFVGGTRQFARATGGLVAEGRFTATGGTEGTYSGEYCLGSKP